MATYMETIATEYNYPNITIYKQFRDGVQYGWHITTNDGYVMYDTSANDMDYDEEDNPLPVIYYYTQAYCPINYNFSIFSWVAVPRDDVPRDMIFGSDNG